VKRCCRRDRLQNGAASFDRPLIQLDRGPCRMLFNDRTARNSHIVVLMSSEFGAEGGDADPRRQYRCIRGAGRVGAMDSAEDSTARRG
jgi:hypothetical protein